MTIVSEPQVWTLIGVFAAVMLGGMTLMTTLITRTTTVAVGGLREEMNARFDAVNARFDAVNARFDAVDQRMDHLDRDVTFLMRRAWDEPSSD
ncbi:MAG: hypothetical protein QM626_07730 [Microbacterium sp.]|uniref:hypothetical protein n=1 Tax=Microbacterium sp. TaxID=51671 RepID=UPI0039E2BDD2